MTSPTKTSRRSRIAPASAVASVLLCAVPALAQPNVDCKKTETQAECHARLKCAADEELDQCQKRLLKCTANESLDACKKRAHSGSQTGSGRDDRNPARDDRGGGPDDRDGRRDDRGGGPDDRDGGRDGRGRERDDRGGRGDDDRRSRRQRNRGRGRDGGKGYASIKTFGLGLELGEPFGLNGKYFLSDSRALDFGVGEIYHHYYYGDGIHLYVDHLWHPVSLVSSPTLELPFYIGVGARYWDFEYCERIGGVDVCDRGSAIGLRIPVGLSFDFNNAPIDIFVQLVPVVDLLYGDYYDRFNDRGHVGIDGSVGIRFWFK